MPFIYNAKLISNSLGAINSINFARILAQVVYYFYAYFRWLDLAGSSLGDHLSFAVPSGNFGDALAGFYASQMGLPVGRLVSLTLTLNSTLMPDNGIYQNIFILSRW